MEASPAGKPRVEGGKVLSRNGEIRVLKGEDQAGSRRMEAA